jgi:hypothetical protein
MSEGEYVHGTMDISAQRSTFGLFYNLTKWGSVIVAIAVVMLALTRTNAPDCSKGDQAAAHLNACGKINHGAEGAAAE